MKKNSKFKFFIILILISICIFFILKNINKNNSNSNNLTESGNSIAENSTVTTNSTEPEISNIQKMPFYLPPLLRFVLCWALTTTSSSIVPPRYIGITMSPPAVLTPFSASVIEEIRPCK